MTDFKKPVIDFRRLGMLAYRSGNIKDATELLLHAIDLNNDDWMARLYLAMCYQRSNKLVDAHRLFVRISKECPDHEIARSAELALPKLASEVNLHLQRMRAATEPLPKPQAATPVRSLRRDDDDIVWIG